MPGAEVLACLPDHLHWFSRAILDHYLAGSITAGEFMRWFHMPNSDYLMVSECVVALLDPQHDPYRFAPGVLDGYIH